MELLFLQQDYLREYELYSIYDVTSCWLVNIYLHFERP